jgi:hypothetical protein
MKIPMPVWKTLSDSQKIENLFERCVELRRIVPLSEAIRLALFGGPREGKLPSISSVTRPDGPGARDIVRNSDAPGRLATTGARRARPLPLWGRRRKPMR